MRIFAVERFARAVVFGALAYVLWRFRSSRHSVEQAFDRERPVLRSLLHGLGYNIDRSKIVGLIQHALALSSTTLKLLTAALALYVVIEIIEGVGLWLSKRWGEYFAMIATSLGLPYEIYELADKITVTRVVLFVINLVLVLYLVLTKRLLGVRGGKDAYEARQRSESVLAAAGRAAAPLQGAPPAEQPPSRPPAEHPPVLLPAEQSPAPEPGGQQASGSTSA